MEQVPSPSAAKARRPSSTARTPCPRTWHTSPPGKGETSPCTRRTCLTRPRPRCRPSRRVSHHQQPTPDNRPGPCAACEKRQKSYAPEARRNPSASQAIDPNAMKSAVLPRVSYTDHTHNVRSRSRQVPSRRGRQRSVRLSLFATSDCPKCTCYLAADRQQQQVSGTLLGNSCNCFISRSAKKSDQYNLLFNYFIYFIVERGDPTTRGTKASRRYNGV